MEPLSAAGACVSILKCYTQLRERFETMKNIEKNWQDLMTEVLSYEVLVKKKASELVQLSKDEADVDPHMGAIQVFEASIKGLCELFPPVDESKGALKKAYSLLRRFSATPENAKKLKEYTCKISRAAALISLSEIVAVKDQVASVESKVDALINDGRVLLEKLNQALDKHRAENNAEELAKSVASLLGRDITDIREDLRANHDELKELLGESFNRVHVKLEKIEDKLDKLTKDLDKMKLPSPSVKELPSPSVSVTGCQFRTNGSERADVRGRE
jgi:hypothetical protein